MDLAPRALVLGLALATCSIGLHAQDLAAPSKVTLTSPQMEAFLLKAKIIAKKKIPTGTTDPVKATLSDGTLTHDAQIQTVDVAMNVFSAGKATELNFKDSYRYNIAGYRVAVLLGLENVPMSVERRIENKMAAVTWWIDDVLMDEKARMSTTPRPAGPDPDRTAKQTHVMRVWDELIQNRDRNQGNILWTKDWKLWLIDHTRAFRTGVELMKLAQLTRCERSLLERLRGLTAESVAAAAGRSLTKEEAAAVAGRAALIVKHFDERIATLGQAAVLFTL